MNNSLIEGIFIDFDGVISKNSLDITLKFVTNYINKISPLPLGYVKNYYKTVNSFSLFDALYLLFNSLGLTNQLNDMLEKIKNLKEYNNEIISITEDFYHLIDYCNKNDIRYIILTLAPFNKIQLFLDKIPIKNICCLEKKTKANVNTYEHLKKDLNINLNNWILIDDDPLALTTANICGLKTILMKSTLFDESYIYDFGQFINAKVDSFDNIINYLRNQL